MAQRPETKQVLQARPSLAAQTGAANRASKDDGHSPARCIRLPTTLSAAKYSAASSRAARQFSG